MEVRVAAVAELRICQVEPGPTVHHRRHVDHSTAAIEQVVQQQHGQQRQVQVVDRPRKFVAIGGLLAFAAVHPGVVDQHGHAEFAGFGGHPLDGLPVGEVGGDGADHRHPLRGQ